MEKEETPPSILLFWWGGGDRSGSKTRLIRADLNLHIYKNFFFLGGGYFCFLQYFNSHQKIKAIKLILSNNPSIDEKEEEKKIYMRFDLHFVFMKRFYLQHLRFQNDHLFTLLIKNQTAYFKNDFILLGLILIGLICH